MEYLPVELRLAQATLAATARERAAPKLQTLRPRTLAPAPGKPSVIVQREVSALTILTREVEPRAFPECAYEPPTPADADAPKMAGAARWELLSLDLARVIVSILAADDMGALACAHRAFALPVEDAARTLLRPYADAEAPLRCRASNAFCEPAWRAYKAAARYHRPHARAGLAAGGGHSLAARRGRAFACGRGTCGQLGLGPEVYDVAAPRQLPWALRVAGVAAGAHHSLAVCADGSLWAWGKASDHQLGAAGAGAPTLSAPARVELRDGGGRCLAAQCAAGAAHSLAVDVAGGLWSWGRNAHGQLGHGTTRPAPLPRRVLPLRARPAVAAAAGAFHSLCVLREGALYAFGLGADGRLGLGHQLTAPLPEKVPLDAFARCAAAGATHSACVDDRGALYTWGDGAKGQLGHRGPRPRAPGKRDSGLASMPSWESARALGEALQFANSPAPDSEHAPRCVAALRHVRVVAVQCNDRETVCLDADGAVFVVGPSPHAADPPAPAASPRAAAARAAPSPLVGIGRARAVGRPRAGSGPSPRAGRPKSAVLMHRFHAPVLEIASTARHALVRTVDDTYFAWGDGAGGALGVGDAKDRTRPTALPWP